MGNIAIIFYYFRYFPYAKMCCMNERETSISKILMECEIAITGEVRVGWSALFRSETALLPLKLVSRQLFIEAVIHSLKFVISIILDICPDRFEGSFPNLSKKIGLSEKPFIISCESFGLHNTYLLDYISLRNLWLWGARGQMIKRKVMK